MRYRTMSYFTRLWEILVSWKINDPSENTVIVGGNRTDTMEDPGPRPVTILDVLRVDLCARAILDYVPISDLVRSERVCWQWQQAVYHYLRTPPTLTVIDLYSDGDKLPTYSSKLRHRGIEISLKKYPRTFRKTINKLGSAVEKLMTNRNDEKYFSVIASKCPYLRHIEFNDLHGQSFQTNQIMKLKNLKQITLTNTKDITDFTLSKLFEIKDFENITIYNTSLTGSFLKTVKSNSLKSLSLNNCLSLDVSELQAAVNNLRNVRNLELNGNCVTVLSNLHLIINEMPELEELSLRHYNYAEFTPELIESFSRLGKLKRLDMRENKNVSDVLLNALGKGCWKLEYLDIRDDEPVSSLSVHGVAALCRCLSVMVTLCLGHLTYDNDLAVRIRSEPFYQDLETMGVELTPRWLGVDSRSGHQARKSQFALRARYGAVQNSRRELKIILRD